MKITGLDNRRYSLDYTKYPLKETSCSSPQKKVGEALTRIFPGAFIAEEMPCLGAGNIRLDFYIHRSKIAFEVDGEQHDAFTEFFHGTRAKFAESQRRDHQKEAWCHNNGITLYRIGAELIRSMTEEALDLFIKRMLANG